MSVGPTIRSLKGNLNNLVFSDQTPMNDVTKEQIITLLQMLNRDNPVIWNFNQCDQFVGQLVSGVTTGVLPEDQLNELMRLMATQANAPIIAGLSPTAVKIAWWRNVITWLFAGGITIAAINAIVPIPFAFIATTIFAGGKAVASAVAGLLSPVDIGNAAAQAAAQAGAPNMVNGPSIDALKSLGGYFYLAAATVLGTLAGAAVQVCRAATGAAIENCTMANSEKVADAAFLTLITKGMRRGGDKL